jgi:3'-phosphoadenosine 5'-phosphosulfate sulfotransferase (PAPS reductase)/FAD synthetase
MPLSDLLEKSRLAFAMRGKAIQNAPKSAEQVVKDAFEQLGDGLCVSWSAGACSTIVLKLALEVNPKVKVVF